MEYLNETLKNKNKRKRNNQDMESSENPCINNLYNIGKK